MNIEHQQNLILEQLSESYTLIKILGEGAFGKVYECVSKEDNNHYAIKVIEKNIFKKNKIQQLRSEANILQKTNHSNIVKLYSMFQTQSTIYLIMELIEGGTLAKLMKQRWQKQLKFTEYQISQIMKSIFEGVSYIHSFNIIHRDLKPCIKHFNFRSSEFLKHQNC